jgi:hypothetical protein
MPGQFMIDEEKHEERVDGPEDSNQRLLQRPVFILVCWMALLLIAAPFLGINWFNPGDLSYREAMYYHGIGVSAWMVLVLVAAGSTLKPYKPIVYSIIGVGSVSSGLLVGIGGAMVGQEGISLASVVITVGMVVGDLTALISVLLLLYDLWTSRGLADKILARSALIVALASLSLSTPLGHLAGMVQDFGEGFPPFAFHLSLIGAKAEDVLGGYIGSHSHEIIAALLAAMILVPAVIYRGKQKPWQNIFERAGCAIIILSTIVQTAIYQYSAWWAWEPSTLFESGPNGMPLDDVVLAILGIGMLLLSLTFLPIAGDKVSEVNKSRRAFRSAIAILAFTFIISIVGLGIYIEFHEAFFGGGEGSAPGVVNDLAYIRGHILFGFMILPALFAASLAGLQLPSYRRGILASLITISAGVLGGLGMYFWTFYLNSTLMEVCYFVAVLSLLSSLVLPAL